MISPSLLPGWNVLLGFSSTSLQIGLSMVSDCLPGLSMAASLALEDLAYAYYVLEYTSGEFEFALNCADKAIDMLKLLGHQSCMQSASANRVKGESARLRSPLLGSSALFVSQPVLMFVSLLGIYIH